MGPGSMLSPQYISLKPEKPGLNLLQKPVGFFKSPIRPDYAELLIFLLIDLRVDLNKRLK